MKRLAVMVLIISAAIFCLETTFSKAEIKNAKPAAKATSEKTKAAKEANTVASKNKVTDVNQAGEPNEADAVEKEFNEASSAADKEYQEVMRQSTENRVKMMTAVQKQTMAELEFIRDLAIQEGATKTAKAVELAMEKRKVRYDEMVQNVKERQEREAARAERESKREKEHRTDQRRRTPSRQ